MPPPRFAAIDVGSNTMKLLIVEPNDVGGFTPVFQTSRPARLGKGIHARQLRESVMDSAIESLAEFASLCRSNRVEKIAAVGTSALRDAENREDFLVRARGLGIDIQVIPGEEEAKLSFTAVLRDPHWRDSERLLVIDIGGGSTEVIFGNRQGIESRVSLPLGAVRMTEAALDSDPPTVREMAEAARLASEGLQGLQPAEANYTAVGVGGTLTNMCRVAMGLSIEDIGNGEKIHGASLTLFEVEKQVERYASCTVEQRRRILGLDPARADVILGGAVILFQAMQKSAVDAISVSTRGLRWGLLYDRFGK